ncbi:hypothetical protein GQ54DRAFT_128768 [Martensiomyces pterosporus]|nr:hypothetical protein GQ54DRAFT_128768 [Martensiomyces pterosporus]
MGELVAYEDSPLGQYLQEIEAAEALVVDEQRPATNTNGDDSSSIPGAPRVLSWRSTCEWTMSLAASTFGVPVDSVGEKLSTLVWEEIIDILAASGHLEARYTPKSSSRLQRIRSALHAADKVVDRRAALSFAIWRTLPPLALGSALMIRSRNPSARYALAAALLAPALGIVTNIALWYVKGKRASVQCRLLVDDFESMSLACRSMDNAIQRALRFVQEVEFVANGFRLPHYQGSLAIAANPGQGTAIAVAHIRQAIDTALLVSSGVLFGSICNIRAGPCVWTAAENLEIDSAVGDMRSRHGGLYEPGNMSLEALRSKFNLHFSLRKTWLDLLLKVLEPTAQPKDELKQTDRRSLLHLIKREVQGVSKAASDGTNTVKQAEEAQYTSKRWAALIDAKSTNQASHHPLVRSLNGMADTLGTIQAKIHVCRECIGLEEQQPDSSGSMAGGSERAKSASELSRLFSSLKTEIDVLNSQYQAAFASLVCSDQDPGLLPADGKRQANSSVVPGTPSYEVDPSAVPEGAHIVGYSPIGTDLDAPEMVFEADVEADSDAGKARRPNLDRSERIRLQRQRRIDEAAERKRKGEIHSMLSELRSAIDDRSKSGTKRAAE